MIGSYTKGWFGGKRVSARQAVPVLSILALLSLWAISPVDFSKKVLSPRAEESSFSFGDTRTIGQTFKAIPNMRAIEMHLEIEPDAQGPLILHIRRSFFGEDIRRSVIFHPSTGKQVFTFSPLRMTRGEQLIWVLENPHDPDRSTIAFREIDGSIYSEGEAFTKGKELPGDFEFTAIGSRAVVTTLPQKIIGASGQASFDSKEQKALKSGLVLAIVAWIFAPLFIRFLRFLLARPKIALTLLLATSLCLHVYTAKTIPVNNDEGAYLQDAVQVQAGFVPIKDFLTKGPVYVYSLALWLNIVPPLVPLLRLLSTIAWLVEIILAYKLLKEFSLPEEIALCAAALLALSPAAVLLSTPLLLQSISVVLVLTGLLMAIKGAKQNSTILVFLSAVIMVVAYLTRASSAAGAVVGLVLIWLFSERRRASHVATYVMTGALLAIVTFFGAVSFMGWGKAMVAFNIEALTVSQARETSKIATKEPLVRWSIQSAEVLWIMSPWLIAAIAAIPTYVVRLAKRWQAIVLFSLWFMGIALILFHLSDMSYFIGASHVYSRALAVCVLVAPIIIVGMRWLSGKRIVTISSEQKRSIIVALVWILVLGALYRSWNDFRHNYLLEFLPPIVFLAAQWATPIWKGLVKTAKNNIVFVPVAAIVFLLTSAGLTGWYNGLSKPPSGTMDISSLSDIVNAVRITVPAREPIFTAQSTITALARRPIIYQYSHSGWYLYEKQGVVPKELREIFFVDPGVVTKYLEDTARFVILDRRTDQVYFASYPERQAILAEQFEEISTVKNGSDNFQLLRRKAK